jgi:hypothetical protein
MLSRDWLIGLFFQALPSELLDSHADLPDLHDVPYRQLGSLDCLDASEGVEYQPHAFAFLLAKTSALH